MLDFIKTLFKGVTVHNEPKPLDEVKMTIKVSKNEPINKFNNINTTTGINTGDDIFSGIDSSKIQQSKSKNESFNKLVGDIKKKTLKNEPIYIVVKSSSRITKSGFTYLGHTIDLGSTIKFGNNPVYIYEGGGDITLNLRGLNYDIITLDMLEPKTRVQVEYMNVLKNRMY